MDTKDLETGRVWCVTSRTRLPVYLLSLQWHVLSMSGRSGRLEPRPRGYQAQDGSRVGLPAVLLPEALADEVAANPSAIALPEALGRLLLHGRATLAPSDLGNAVPVQLRPERFPAKPTLVVVQSRNITGTWADYATEQRDAAESKARELAAAAAVRDELNAEVRELADLVGLALDIHPSDMSGKALVDKRELVRVLRNLVQATAGQP